MVFKSHQEKTQFEGPPEIGNQKRMERKGPEVPIKETLHVPSKTFEMNKYGHVGDRKVNISISN